MLPGLKDSLEKLNSAISSFRQDSFNNHAIATISDQAILLSKNYPLFVNNNYGIDWHSLTRFRDIMEFVDADRNRGKYQNIAPVFEKFYHDVQNGELLFLSNSINNILTIPGYRITTPIMSKITNFVSHVRDGQHLYKLHLELEGIFGDTALVPANEDERNAYFPQRQQQLSEHTGDPGYGINVKLLFQAARTAEAIHHLSPHLQKLFPENILKSLKRIRQIMFHPEEAENRASLDAIINENKTTDVLDPNLLTQNKAAIIMGTKLAIHYYDILAERSTPLHYDVIVDLKLLPGDVWDFLNDKRHIDHIKSLAGSITSVEYNNQEVVTIFRQEIQSFLQRDESSVVNRLQDIYNHWNTSEFTFLCPQNYDFLSQLSHYCTKRIEEETSGLEILPQNLASEIKLMRDFINMVKTKHLSNFVYIEYPDFTSPSLESLFDSDIIFFDETNPINQMQKFDSNHKNNPSLKLKEYEAVKAMIEEYKWIYDELSRYDSDCIGIEDTAFMEAYKKIMIIYRQVLVNKAIRSHTHLAHEISFMIRDCESLDISARGVKDPLFTSDTKKLYSQSFIFFTDNIPKDVDDLKLFTESARALIISYYEKQLGGLMKTIKQLDKSEEYTENQEEYDSLAIAIRANNTELSQQYNSLKSLEIKVVETLQKRDFLILAIDQYQEKFLDILKRQKIISVLSQLISTLEKAVSMQDNSSTGTMTDNKNVMDLDFYAVVAGSLIRSLLEDQLTGKKNDIFIKDSKDKEFFIRNKKTTLYDALKNLQINRGMIAHLEDEQARSMSANDPMFNTENVIGNLLYSAFDRLAEMKELLKPLHEIKEMYSMHMKDISVPMPDIKNIIQALQTDKIHGQEESHYNQSVIIPAKEDFEKIIDQAIEVCGTNELCLISANYLR